MYSRELAAARRARACVYGGCARPCVRAGPGVRKTRETAKTPHPVASQTQVNYLSRVCTHNHDDNNVMLTTFTMVVLAVVVVMVMEEEAAAAEKKLAEDTTANNTHYFTFTRLYINRLHTSRSLSPWPVRSAIAARLEMMCVCRVCATVCRTGSRAAKIYMHNGVRGAMLFPPP